VSNHEFAARHDTLDEWIVSRTGIRARRTLEGSGLATSDLAVAAARMALARARVDPARLDLVIVATCSGDYPIPSTACLVQAAIAARLHKIAMNGPDVFRAAVEAMADALAAASERAGVRPTDLRWVFAHQANARIVRSVAERLGVTLAAFRMNVERYGNTG